MKNDQRHDPVELIDNLDEIDTIVEQLRQTGAHDVALTIEAPLRALLRQAHRYRSLPTLNRAHTPEQFVQNVERIFRELR